jgi:hypothetical protein
VELSNTDLGHEVRSVNDIIPLVVAAATTSLAALDVQQPTLHLIEQFKHDQSGCIRSSLP